MAEKPQQPTKSFWSKAGTGSKSGFDKLWGWADKLGAPVNKLSNKLGSEAFWPTSLDKESQKAARILQSFCKDGFYEEELRTPPDGGPKTKQKVVKKIPQEVIQKAKGLAIFTTMRTGLWISGAGGSGVLVARKQDGNWGPPVGIMLHTAGLGFLVGVDIYDCVLVLNTDQAVEAFSKWRATIGGEISAVAGPVGIGGVLDSEVHKRQSPIFAYLKSRGFYAGVQIDGTVIIERVDENERFYGQRLPAMDILMGKAQSREMELEMLTETLKAAQGDANVRLSLLPNEPPPADFEVVESDHKFGVPDREDPDPYGVLALENAGLVIKEAGSKMPASPNQFEFNPKPDSPVFRSSFDGSASQRSVRSSWRESRVERPYRTSEIGVQTDFELPPTPTKRASGPPPPLPPRQSVRQSISSRSIQSVQSSIVKEEEPRDLGITMEDNDNQHLAETVTPRNSLPPLPKRISNPVEGQTQTTPMINGFGHDSHKDTIDVDAVEQKVESDGTKADVPIEDHKLEDVVLDQTDERLDTVNLNNTDRATPTKAGIPEEHTDDTTPTKVQAHDEYEPKPDSVIDNEDEDEDEDADDDDSDEFDEVAEFHEVHEAQAPQAIQARVVSVPKRITPQLPSRNPGRVRNVQSVSSRQQSEASSVRSTIASVDDSASHEDNRRSSATSNPPSLGKAQSLQSIADETSIDDKATHEDTLSHSAAVSGGFLDAELSSSPPPVPGRSIERGHSPAVVDTKDEQPVEVSKALDAYRRAASPPSRGRSLTRAETPSKDQVDTPTDLVDQDYSEAEIVTATVHEQKPQPIQNRISMAQIRGGLHDDDDDDEEDDESRSQSPIQKDKVGRLGEKLYGEH